MLFVAIATFDRPANADTESEYVVVPLVNHQFEEGYSGWVRHQPTSLVGFAQRGDTAVRTKFAGGRVAQTVEVEQGRSYLVTAWVAGNGAIGATIGGEEFAVEQRGSSERYKKVEVRFESGDADEVTIFGAHLDGTGWFDDFRLWQLPEQGSSDSEIDLACWEAEGPDPQDGDAFVFDALQANVVTLSGNGPRHELKIRQECRGALDSFYEELSGRITVDMSPGAKSIVTQYHTSGIGTLVKLYVSDSREHGFDDSNPANGVFDVYVRMDLGGTVGEVKHPLGSVERGEWFDFSVINDHGEVTVSASNDNFSASATEIIGGRSEPDSYLKMGNYLQAQNPYNLENEDDPALWDELFASLGIDTAVLTFTNVQHQSLPDE